MKQNRREFVKLTGVFAVMAGAGLISTKEALAQQQAWNKAAFEAKSLDETVKALGGPAASTERGHFHHRARHRRKRRGRSGRRHQQDSEYAERLHPGREESELACCRICDSGGNRSQRRHPHQDGPDLERARGRQSRQQVLRRHQGSQSHPRRLRRLSDVRIQEQRWQIR